MTTYLRKSKKAPWERPKRNKYNQGSTKKDKGKKTWNGVLYDSIAEMKWAQTLRLALDAGEIVKVEEQIHFRFILQGILVSDYTADFRVTYRTGKVEIHDVKDYREGQRDWPMRSKLFLAMFCLENGWEFYSIEQGERKPIAKSKTKTTAYGEVARTYTKGWRKQ